VVSLPHTLLTKSYDWCAYTAKVRRFISMVAAAGHEVIVYGPDVQELEPVYADYVSIVQESDRLEWFGGPEWNKDEVFDRWDLNDVCWQVSNHRAAEAIRERWQPGDILGLIGGLCQLQIITELSDLNPLTTEWGIGYSGVIEGTHKVFESYAWMHHVAARRRTDDMHFFDTVVPNCFDVDDFDFGAEPGEYLLYMGRPNPRKGLPIIADIAARTKIPVIIAGQPGPVVPGTSYAGLVTGKAKKQLLAGARALLCPTTYLEPFGGVAVEAMMSGTPVIATDYGAFTETVVQGYTGYRCRMLADFMAAVDDVETLDRETIRDYSSARYSTVTGARLYDIYLRRLSSLYADGWYAGAGPVLSMR
jgi:glycosyltransferase involved in cell wall biosynthesis